MAQVPHCPTSHQMDQESRHISLISSQPAGLPPVEGIGPVPPHLPRDGPVSGRSGLHSLHAASDQTPHDHERRHTEPNHGEVVVVVVVVVVGVVAAVAVVVGGEREVGRYYCEGV